MSDALENKFSNRVLLTGPMHCGKSTLVRSLLTGWEKPVCGYASDKRWNAKAQQTEIWLHNFFSGADCCFATCREQEDFVVDLAQFDDFITAALDPKVLMRVSLLCVDEIGFLEQDSERLLPALQTCTTSAQPIFLVAQERVFRIYQGILPAPPWLHVDLRSDLIADASRTILTRLRGGS